MPPKQKQAASQAHHELCMGQILQPGFTLIELVCTIVLLGILSISAFMIWPGTTINIGAEAQQVADDIRYTQSLSMTQGERYRFVITSSTTYQIVNSNGTAVLNAVGSSTTTLNNQLSFGALSNLPNQLIAFDGNGNPYVTTGSPGSALLVTARIPINGEGATKTITIAPQTGSVLLQ